MIEILGVRIQRYTVIPVLRWCLCIQIHQLVTARFKRKNPRILLIIYSSSFTKVCSLLKLNLSLVSRTSAEFLNIWPGQTEAGTMSVIDVFDGLFPRNTVRIQHTGRDYVT